MFCDTLEWVLWGAGTHASLLMGHVWVEVAESVPAPHLALGDLCLSSHKLSTQCLALGKVPFDFLFTEWDASGTPRLMYSSLKVWGQARRGSKVV